MEVPPRFQGLARDGLDFLGGGSKETSENLELSNFSSAMAEEEETSMLSSWNWMAY